MTAVLPPSAPAAGRPSPLLPGATLLPGYTVVGHVRRGEDFDAYEAWSATRYCHCLVKVPRPDRADDAAVHRALVREGRLLLGLDHPHWVRAYQLHTPDDGAPALVLEAVTGPSLRDLLDEHRRLPTRVLGVLGQHLCSATRYLHDRGHLHLDLTPRNVVVNGGVARVVDLGASRSPGPCRAGLGTARSMAPEQARGEPVSAATDAWGIGLLLHEAATGQRPFGDGGSSAGGSSGGGGSSAAPRFLQLERRAPRVRTQRMLPRAAAEAIDACLAPDPADRPSLHALDAALGELVTAES